MSSSSLIPEIYIGDLRIQILSDCLIRFEKADASGFEEQATFHIVSRFFSMPSFQVTFLNSFVRIETRLIRFDIPIYVKNLTELRFKVGKKCFKVKQTPIEAQDLPEPGQLEDYWLLADFPRMIPPEMGATAPPKELEEDFLSGWQISDNVVDFYLFFPAISGYERFRRELINLTGQIPLVPKHALGLIYSRNHPFTDSEILETVRQYRLRRMPIDMFVVDSSWRVGDSRDYEVNTEHFPDVSAFFSIMHEKKIKVMFNDHPEPFEPLALFPQELQQREKGLGNLLGKGLDSWCYDRNWNTPLDEPAPGLGPDVWGMRLFFDITQKLKPLERALIMSNVPGIKDGVKESPSNISSHRFPIWWTGNSEPGWESLKNAIENAVNEGIKSLMPYVSDDVGGHLGEPSPELFARFVQFASFSPVFRPHCAQGQCRDPWEFGEEAERIMGNYLGLRLKLIPMIYSAAKEASETGLPILRRCDLEWPEFKEARTPYQYCFGNDLLVAPIFTPVKKYDKVGLPTSVKEAWIPPGIWHNIWTGQLIEGPGKKFIRCNSWVTPIFAREGAVIISQPEQKNTGTQNWEKLVVDVFVPEKRMEVTRNLYEDDGFSNSYLEGQYSITSLKLKRVSDDLELRIEKPEGDYLHEFAHRSWLIRFHFSKRSRMASINLNGNFLMPDRYAFINKVDRPGSVPFICRPGYAGIESGETIELEIDRFDLQNQIFISLKVA